MGARRAEEKPRDPGFTSAFSREGGAFGRRGVSGHRPRAPVRFSGDRGKPSRRGRPDPGERGSFCLQPPRRRRPSPPARPERGAAAPPLTRLGRRRAEAARRRGARAAGRAGGPEGARRRWRWRRGADCGGSGGRRGARASRGAGRMAGGAGWAGAPAALLRSVRRLREVFEVCGRDPDGFLRVERVAALGLRFGQGEEVRALRPRAPPASLPSTRPAGAPPAPAPLTPGPSGRPYPPDPLPPPRAPRPGRTPAFPHSGRGGERHAARPGWLPCPPSLPRSAGPSDGGENPPDVWGAGAVRTRPRDARPPSLPCGDQAARVCRNGIPGLGGGGRAPHWASNRGWRGQQGALCSLTAPTLHTEGG